MARFFFSKFCETPRRHEFSASKYFVRMMMTHPWRTWDPKVAEVFIVPRLGAVGTFLWWEISRKLHGSAIYNP